MMLLCTKMRAAILNALQPWYAVDGVAGGQAQNNAACCRSIVDNGPRYGYKCQSSKCVYIYKKEDEAVMTKEYARQGLVTSFARGQAYLGRHIGIQRLKAT